MRYFAVGLLLAFLLSSCRAVSLNSPSIPETSPTPITSALVTARPLSVTQPPAVTSETLGSQPEQPTPTSTIAAVPTISPSAVATSAPLARFQNLRFATTPDARPQQIFPAGTTEIFSVWEYRNMQAGDRIRRIWFRNEQIWLTREEYWNWDLYQASGSVRDISIFDNEGSGLEPGAYRLQLYVNDNLQQEAGFTVLAQ